MNGIEHIQSAFAAARAEQRAALMPYCTLGYPSPTAALDVLEAVAKAGADLIELGVPFSDPLADGPTIQRSTQVALEQGMTVAGCLEMTAQLRARGVTQPLMLMGYVNPLLAYGIPRFCQDARAAGADGLIIPDLPPEEAGELAAACQAQGLALIYLLSPASPVERMAPVVAQASGFLYLVSLTGVTGARSSLPPELPAFVARVRTAAPNLPLAVGFGIATPEHAHRVGQFADGVIVGSALVDAIGKAKDPARAAGEFVGALRRGMEEGKCSANGKNGQMI